ncbi:hypothetical protein BH23GEM9_BH23GEM9_11800 [soil metagenome]
MHDILKERLWRKLQTLPQEQVYQALDYIEFLEARYAREQAVKADPIQKFAERIEDGLRMRSVAPKVITGTVGLLGTARRVLRTVSDAGRDILDASHPAPRPSGSGGAGHLSPRTSDAPHNGTARALPRPQTPQTPETGETGEKDGA